MSYQYDVFLSYTSDAGMLSWVENHFLGALKECLEAEWPYPPAIYNYRAQPIGTKWPDKVKQAHLRSRFLVGIWAPPYFRSEWCMAEWKSMCRRATDCQVETEHVLYPIRYGDGEHFPEDARKQLQADFSEWAVPGPVFQTTAPYAEFYKAVRKLAETLAGRLQHVPAWSADFPSVEPPPLSTPQIGLPRL